MKIEKLNDNQIRATLYREDLESRHIRLSELAYGTEAARSLFNELLRFASYKLGFEVDDTPLMVEAIPLTSGAIVIIVTKVPYPEELDTRFSHFSDAPLGGDFGDYEEADLSPGEIVLPDAGQKATDILDVKGTETESSDSGDASQNPEPVIIPPEKYTRLFRISTIDDVLQAARVVSGLYDGTNSLYHTLYGYELIVHISDHSADEFNRVINILSEYGSPSPLPGRYEDYFREHARPICRDRALQVLAQI